MPLVALHWEKMYRELKGKTDNPDIDALLDKIAKNVAANPGKMNLTDMNDREKAAMDAIYAMNRFQVEQDDPRSR